MYKKKFALITGTDSFFHHKTLRKKVFFFLNSSNNVKVKGKSTLTKETQTILLTFKELEGGKKGKVIGQRRCLSLFIYLILRSGAAPAFGKRIFRRQLSILWSRNCISVHCKSG